MKILGIAGSNSKKSINKSLVNYATSLFEKADINVIDLNDYEVAIYGIDRELATGIPPEITALASLIDKVDLLVISLAEHNSTYTVAFKNVYDWLSRVPNRKAFSEKPMLLMATSPGGRGGAAVLEAAQSRFPRDGSELLSTFSLPSFHDNFKDGEISNIALRIVLIRAINQMKYSNFDMYYKDNSFTCGIDASKDDSGDAIEY
jgi:chromate reductase